MTDTIFDEMGPIDCAVLEWRGREPADTVAPLLLDLVDRGIIRIPIQAILASFEATETASTTGA